MRPLQYHVLKEVKPHLSNFACSAGTYGLKLFYFMYIYIYFLYKCVLQKYSSLQNSVPQLVYSSLFGSNLKYI